ncbi:MAG: hypothetical protein K9L70_10540 [Thiohalocapsa sp.]|nr:hypothetical protein [Thiohalocapsa sp.]MCF7992578.1 hypothetical protein [Thiohalocapsa sp.]
MKGRRAPDRPGSASQRQTARAPRAADRFALGLRAAAALVLSLVAYLTLVFVLEEEARYAMFDWLQAPGRRPWLSSAGAACGVLLWLLTRRLAVGPPPLPDWPYRRTRKAVRMTTDVAGLFTLLAMGSHLASTAPAPVSAIEDVEVHALYTPSGQSKPVRHHVQVVSWRGDGRETLTTTAWYLAQPLADAGRARVFIGRDWLGSVRVLRVEPLTPAAGH